MHTQYNVHMKHLFHCPKDLWGILFLATFYNNSTCLWLKQMWLQWHWMENIRRRSHIFCWLKEIFGTSLSTFKVHWSIGVPFPLVMDSCTYTCDPVFSYSLLCSCLASISNDKTDIEVAPSMWDVMTTNWRAGLSVKVQRSLASQTKVWHLQVSYHTHSFC